MGDDRKSRKNSRPRRDHLPPEVKTVLDQIETEDMPENLLRLARQLQDALDEKLRRDRR